MRRMLQPYSRHVEAVFEPVIVPQLSSEQHRRLAVATAQLYAAGEGNGGGSRLTAPSSPKHSCCNRQVFEEGGRGYTGRLSHGCHLALEAERVSPWMAAWSVAQPGCLLGIA